jgi:hypothetical protein
LPARCLPEHAGALHDALEAESSLRSAIGALSPKVLAERELSALGDPRRLCFSVNSAEDLQLATRWLAEAPVGG